MGHEFAEKLVDGARQPLLKMTALITSQQRCVPAGGDVDDDQQK